MVLKNTWHSSLKKMIGYNDKIVSRLSTISKEEDFKLSLVAENLLQK